MSNEQPVRYSDEELNEFKEIINKKLAKATEEYEFTDKQITELNENGFNQQGGDMYDDSTSHAELEMLQRMAQRQKRYIQDLGNALLRIRNKTYGVCTVTGKLIDKQRLRLVPHATKSVDGKKKANSIQNESSDDPAFRDPFMNQGTQETLKGKKVAQDRLYAAQPKPPASADDWEPDNEAIEDAAYNLRKLDEDED